METLEGGSRSFQGWATLAVPSPLYAASSPWLWLFLGGVYPSSLCLTIASQSPVSWAQERNSVSLHSPDAP